MSYEYNRSTYASRKAVAYAVLNDYFTDFGRLDLCKAIDDVQSNFEDSIDDIWWDLNHGPWQMPHVHLETRDERAELVASWVRVFSFGMEAT